MKKVRNFKVLSIQRHILSKIQDWYQSPISKPLVIQGARQVGKTWVMRHFGEQHFKKIALGIAAFSPMFCWLYD